MHSITSTCPTRRSNRGIKETTEHRAISHAGRQPPPRLFQLLGSIILDTAIISFQLPQPHRWLKPPRQHLWQQRGSRPTAASAAMPYRQLGKGSYTPPPTPCCAPYVGLCVPGAGAAAQDAAAARLLHAAPQLGQSELSGGTLSLDMAVVPFPQGHTALPHTHPGYGHVGSRLAEQEPVSLLSAVTSGRIR